MYIDFTYLPIAFRQVISSLLWVILFIDLILLGIMLTQFIFRK